MRQKRVALPGRCRPTGTPSETSLWPATTFGIAVRIWCRDQTAFAGHSAQSRIGAVAVNLIGDLHSVNAFLGDHKKGFFIELEHLRDGGAVVRIVQREVSVRIADGHWRKLF